MKSWETLAAKKREAVNALIPQKWLLDVIPSIEEQRNVTGLYIQQFLSVREIEITETDAVGIVENTTRGTWKAREVTEAFCHRAALAHQLVSCLHEIFFEAAIQDAQRLDEYFATHQKPIGPLHGLPVSLKDQFHVKDVETTMGYVGWIGTFEGKRGTGKERVFESEMVRELRNLGAVLYCKTSVPHTLMCGETVNNIIGYTRNPKNRNLSSGGSSGGEGALIRLGGSPLGFGTDIGGSIRIPAAFNGLYGLRPSAGRLPYEGIANSMDGQATILPVVGPIATSARALRLAIKSLLMQEPWLHDPSVLPLPYSEEKERQTTRLIHNSQLVFGVLRHDGQVQPHPPVRRALDITVETLERLGHQVIEWCPPAHARASEIVAKTWLYDGGRDVHQSFSLSQEPISPQVAFFGTAPSAEHTASEIARNNVAKRSFQKEYLDYWNGTAAATTGARPVDAIIAPVAQFAAARPGMYSYVDYSTWVNLLDYSAAVFPVTTVDKNIDHVDSDYTPLNAEDAAVFESYDPGVFDGAHVSLQLVGRRLEEEKVLALTEMLGDALGRRGVD